MNLLNTPASYGFVSRAIHWIIVLAILAQWVLAENDYNAMHQSIGLLVLLLAVLRLAWRFLNVTPGWPADMRPYEVALARVVHVTFYVLLFAIPLSGWALASVEEEPLRFFDLFDVPRIVLAGEETLEEVHEALFNALVALTALHVIGASQHWLMGGQRRAARMD